MLSELLFYKITFIAILTITGLYLFFSLLYPKLKKYRLFLFVVLMFCALIIKLFLTNPVYIINDHNEVEKNILVIPTHYALVSGENVILKPSPGLFHVWLINNGERTAWLEFINYGPASSPLTRSLIKANHAYHIPQLDYLFTAPPKQINTFKLHDTKGWLYR